MADTLVVFKALLRSEKILNVAVLRDSKRLEQTEQSKTRSLWSWMTSVILSRNEESVRLAPAMQPGFQWLQAEKIGFIHTIKWKYTKY